MKYPETKKVEQVDDYFGTKIEDPYRWFEDVVSSEVETWVDEQNKLTEDFLKTVDRDKIKSRLTQLYNYERVSAPFKRGKNLFYLKNEGLQNHSIMYIKRPEEEDKVFIDPNTFSEDGTISMAKFIFSHDGEYFAYSTAENGGDWETFHFIDVETGELLPDKIDWIKESLVAFYDNGIFYAEMTAPEEGNELTIAHQGGKLFYHKFGTDKKEDKLILEESSEFFYFPSTHQEEKYLLLKKGKEERRTNLYVKDLEEGSDFVELFDSFDYDHYLIEVREDNFYILTNKDAKNKKLISWNYTTREFSEVISESELPIEEIAFAGDKIFVEYTRQASSYIKVYNLRGEFIQDLTLPQKVGMAYGFSAGAKEKETYFVFASTVQPPCIYKLNLETLSYELYQRSNLDFTFENYELRQVEYESFDGQKIPMFISCKKGTKLDGNNLTMLFGYGGFGASIPPLFSPSICYLLERGGIFAQPSVRGGGEFGLEWHHAAVREKREVSFKDFISAGEFLCKEGYTSKENLAIKGGSNGGLLVGATLTMKPDYCAVALPHCGVMDMLRYHLFTEGRRWVAEFGSSEEGKFEFEYLYKYSPVHNVKEETKYPATLVMTGFEDDRVVPSHSYKFISELQRKGEKSSPYLLRVEKGSSHNASNLSKTIEENTDEFAFIFSNVRKDI